jgi:ABC-type transport system involved in multi-copper enzyme maturation permease subunit
MTTTEASAPPPSLGTPGPAVLRLVRSELLKIRTTNAWWIFALGVLVLTGLTFLINMLQAMFFFDSAEELTEDVSEQEAAEILAQTDVVFQAANLYTSGQLLVLIIVLVVGILVVTNEFYHQTATSTFLTVPHRTAVVMAKVVTATLLGAFYWVLSTALNIPLTALFLQARGLDTHLTNPDVVRAILLNLLAYVLWAILGVGFGVLLRSQIAATITGILLYLGGYIGAVIIFNVLANWLDADWILEWQVIVPSIASQLMVAGTELPGSPPQWLGAAVLVGWALVAGTIGVLITRRRDIS